MNGRDAWLATARPQQLRPDGPWTDWMLWTDRGWGSTRAAMEEVMEWIRSGEYKRIALIGLTVRDVRAELLEGPAGLFRIAGEWPFRDRSSKGRVEFPGSLVMCFSASQADAMAGREFDAAVIHHPEVFQPSDLAKVDRELRVWMRHAAGPRRIYDLRRAPANWPAARFTASGTVLQINDTRFPMSEGGALHEGIQP